MTRRISRRIKIGNVYIGGDEKIAVQSLTSTDTRDVEATVKQIKELIIAGCDIVRCAVPDEEAAEALKEIIKQVSIPVVADIHFDYKLAIKSMENGASKVRINPGNIGGIDRIKAVVDTAKKYGVPLRIGVNSGSVEKDLIEKHGGPTPEAMVESVLRHVGILESMDFYDIVIALKSSDVSNTIKSYELIESKVDYPLHLGVTESGTLFRGTIKSAVGIGSLLARGIGDTLRVTLTAPVVEEIKVGREILKSLGLLKDGIEFISCPTCGRTEIDLYKIVEEVEARLGDSKKNIRIAMMGCVVNGPGEAREADIGITGGKGEGLIFKKGKIIKKVPEKDLVEELIAEIEKL